MTIILGFTCLDSLVFASDSQGSYGSSSKRADIKKVIAKTLKNKVIVFARAGSLESADLFEELFDVELEASDLGPPSAIADCAERAMKRTRQRVVENMRTDGFSEDYVAQHMRDQACDVILGYIANKVPRLYRLRLNTGYSAKCSEPYAAEGCASNLAGSVLEGYNLPKLQPPAAIGLAAYAIEFCKTYDSAYSGKTQLALLFQRDAKENFAFFNEAKRRFGKSISENYVSIAAVSSQNRSEEYEPDHPPGAAFALRATKAISGQSKTVN